jgi:hypothetical protein
MSTVKDKLIAELKALGTQQFEELVDATTVNIKKSVDEFLDPSKADALTDLLKRAGELQVKAYAATNPAHAKQYEEAAEDTLSSIETILLGEQVVASREVAALVQKTAELAWAGLKEAGLFAGKLVIDAALKGAFGATGSIGSLLLNLAADALEDGDG